MATSASPTRFNGEHYYDPSFTAEITAKMQVPKRIKIGGGLGDDEEEFTAHLPWQAEKIDMRVPDRILVAGQNKHIGTPAPPRELIIENTFMPPDPGMIRVQTPPRVITLDEHYFPSAAEDFETGHESNDAKDFSDNNEFHLDATQNSFALDRTINNRDFSTTVWNNGPFLKTEEEIVHLRKQLVKMNRKVVNIEREIVSKNQRDKIIFGIATVYFAMKIFMWMSRNN